MLRCAAHGFFSGGTYDRRRQQGVDSRAHSSTTKHTCPKHTCPLPSTMFRCFPLFSSGTHKFVLFSPFHHDSFRNDGRCHKRCDKSCHNSSLDPMRNDTNFDQARQLRATPQSCSSATLGSVPSFRHQRTIRFANLALKTKALACCVFSVVLSFKCESFDSVLLLQ